MYAGRTIIHTLGILVLAAGALWGCGDSGSSSDGTMVKSDADSSSAGAPREEEASMPAGGYAAKLTMPKKLPDHDEVPLAEMFLKAAQVPAAADVNIPAYPDARIVSSMGAMQYSGSSGEGQSLPGMVLLSSDELDAVLAFYKDKLAGWQYQDFYGVHTLWNGPEGSNALDMTAGYSTLSLSEIKADDVFRALWPEMRTKIDVVYDQPGS